MCELTNRRGLGIQERKALKRQMLKQSHSALYQKQMCFSSIKACKLLLVVIQNKTMTLTASSLAHS